MNPALELWHAAGWTMLHFLWVGAFVGLLASLSRTVVRRAPAWLRYACALFWFSMLAVAPLLIGAVVLQNSHWTCPTIPPQSAQQSAIAEIATVGQFRLGLDYQFTQQRLDDPSQNPGIADSPIATAAGTASGWPVSWQRQIESMQPLAEWICGWLPWVWVCGSPLVLCLLMSGVVGADRLRRDAELLVAHPLAARCRHCARSLGIRRRVWIGVSERISAPLLLGIVRPMILLPPAVLGECSAEQLEMILWHELAHVRRCDNLVNLIQRFVEALLFFHPVVWRVSAWVRLEREHCCDAIVLRHVAEPRAYAETLAALAMPELSPRLATASLANHQLVSRIRHILNLEDRAMRVSHKLALVLSVGIICGGVITYSMAQQTLKAPTAQQSNEPQPPQAGGFTAQYTDGPGTSSSSSVPTNGLPAVTLGTDTGTVSAGPTSGISGVLVTTAAPAAGQPGPGGLAAPQTTAESVPGTADPFSANSVQLYRNNDRVRQFNRQTGMVALGLTAQQAPPWSATQLTGAPDTMQAGDFGSAWASATPDGQDEWLQVEFAEPAEAAAVLINETYNPGAVTAVQATDENGQVLAVWKGVDPVGRDRKKGLAIIPLTTPEKVHKLTILIDSKSVPGWNEIDAVGLLDLQGVTHWATRANASSTFASNNLTRHQVGGGLRLVYGADAGPDRVGQLEQQVQRLQHSLDEIKSLLKSQTGPTGGSPADPAAIVPPAVPALPSNGSGAAIGGDRLVPQESSTTSGAAANATTVDPAPIPGFPFQIQQLFVPSAPGSPVAIPTNEPLPQR